MESNVNTDQWLPSIGPFAAPSGLWGTGVALLQFIIVIAAGFNEVQNPTQYSKFADQQSATLPTKYGMSIIYSPSAVLGAMLSLTTAQGGALTLASLCVALHFCKRVLEAVFLHKYSGTADLTTSVFIGAYYALVSALIIITAVPMDLEEEPSQRLGLVVFALGELGNLYHHYLLRQLRTAKSHKASKNDKRRYVVPTGGLFRFVAAPHYLCEIMAMVGIALTAQSLHALLVALGMASYLSGRAVLTHRFYANTFDKSEWSASDTKAIIPYIF